ncbi:hypothetical protein ASF61_17625 [Duganella sp. Leaf126]|uniref:RCC1 domain-containing protein n=1 Tax=Duganella sp. Leaf126 TaxID=1736266 RepID=UPI0006F23C4D|nr:hypothetical protein [Duganella sp. Leaf126]KQQ31046.1 hypothetical protein ASF61_17625 [Duganella sp. Leaf126]
MKNFTSPARWLAPLFALFAVLLSACGGGGGGDSGGGGSTTPAAVTLRSIAITAPSTTLIVNGATLTLTATGTYSDGTTKPLTGLTWSTKSGGASVVQVTSAGIASGKAIGTDSIIATQAASTTTAAVSASIDVTSIAPWTQVAAGGNQTIALKTDGNLYSWGRNLQGQLGDGSNSNRNTPVIVAGSTGVWKQVAMGDSFAVAIRTDGTLWSWGYNLFGQLGQGDQVPRMVPTQVGTAKDWTYVAAGKSHVVALRTSTASSGPAVVSLWVWGNNYASQLGDGKTVDLLVPTRLGTDSWLAVAAGDAHTLAIRRSDQSLWTWGDNTYGQLGNGITGTRVGVPTQVGTANWSAVAAGSNHSLAIRNDDGVLFAWGAGESGQIGNNSTSAQSSPVQIGTGARWTQVAGGLSHSIGVRNDGTLWAWGRGADGQLGQTVAGSLLPLQVGSLNTWKAVAAGANHSAALQTNGNTLSLWTWGLNADGQLGNGSTASATAPVSIAY